MAILVGKKSSVVPRFCISARLSNQNAEFGAGKALMQVSASS